ncbi:hypothetical protein P4110_10175 [Pseudomonas aeruginosa]|nr:hypothetical protein [Pseudomonas aeruginosa]
MSTTSLCPSATREHGPGAKRVLPLLFLTCLLDAAGVGLIVPLLPTLIGQRGAAGGPRRGHPGRRPGDDLRAAAIVLFAGPRQPQRPPGRRPVLVLAMLGFALSYRLLALADSLWMLFLGRALAGSPAPACHRDGLRG